MTTIREEAIPVLVDGGYGQTEVQAIREILTLLDINPDLPAEWATPDRCIHWLRERFGVGHVLSIDVPPGGACTAWFGSVTGPRRAYYGRTLHRALLAVCQAAQEMP